MNYLTIEEQVKLPSAILPTILQTTISPDGNYITYTRYASSDNSHRIVPVSYLYDSTAQSTTKIAVDKPSWSITWHKEKGKFRFLSDFDGKPQIFEQATDTFQPVMVTDVETGIQQYRSINVDDRIYYTSLLPSSAHIQHRNDTYGGFEFVQQEFVRNALYVFNPNDGTVRQLTDSNFFIGQFDVAPDGNHIVFCASIGTGRAYRDYQDLYLLHLETGILERLDVPSVSLLNRLCWSPNSQSFCFTWYPEGKFFLNGQLEIYDVATRTRQLIQTSLDQDLQLTAWHQRGLLGTFLERTNRYVALVQLDGRVERLADDPVCFAEAPSLSPNGQHIAFAKATDKHTMEVFFDGNPVTYHSDLLRNKALPSKSVVRWHSKDGLEIEGILHLPYDFDHRHRYPLLVIAHGGPKGTLPNARLYQDFYPTDQFIANGFIILEPNYRGSDGYGEAFRYANVGKFGPEDYDDVISGVDYLVAIGYADTERVGIMGWSQGGHIAAFCGMYSDRFRAVSVGAGVSNWRTKYMSSDNAISDVQYFGDVTPWEDPELYTRASAVSYAGKFKTPTLIQHGENDNRVPVDNAFELYRALKDHNVPVVFVMLKNVGHAPQDVRTIKAVMEQNLAWFCHHLLELPLQGEFWYA